MSVNKMLKKHMAQIEGKQDIIKGIKIEKETYENESEEEHLDRLDRQDAMNAKFEFLGLYNQCVGDYPKNLNYGV